MLLKHLINGLLASTVHECMHAQTSGLVHYNRTILTCKFLSFHVVVPNKETGIHNYSTTNLVLPTEHEFKTMSALYTRAYSDSLVGISVAEFKSNHSTFL